jgi:hypothetical protein
MSPKAELAAAVCMQRKELEHSVSGLMTEQYPAEYVKHHVDRLHIPGALRLLECCVAKTSSRARMPSARCRPRLPTLRLAWFRPARPSIHPRRLAAGPSRSWDNAAPSLHGVARRPER